MPPQQNTVRNINGKRYVVKTSLLLAHNEYWDGSSFEVSGHKWFLYKDRRDNYFVVGMSKWLGDHSTLSPLSSDEALELYNILPIHENAFTSKIKNTRRHKRFETPVKCTNFSLAEEKIAWLKAQPGHNTSEYIRNLIIQAMK